MALQVPQVQLEANAPTMLQGGRVTPQQDTATKGVEKFTSAMSKAGKQFAQISENLQDQRDDSIYKEKSMEYQRAVSEAKLQFESLENKAAIEQVGTDENNQPITKREQIVADLSAKLEEIAESAENDRQKYMIRTNGEATLLSANNTMTKHEINEGQRYHDTNDLAAIDLAADVTGEDYADHGDPLGEFAKNEATALALVYQYAARKNLPADSPQIKLLIQQTQTKIHTSTLDQMMTKKDFDEAKLYLERNVLTGKASASLYQSYMPKIIAGYDKHIGTIYGDLHANSPHNINTGSINDSSIAILKLESSNTFDNGNSVTVANGFNSDEVNTTQLTEEDAKNNFDAIQKELKVDVVPQHRTHQLFLATKLGSKKADSIFNAAKRELKEAGVGLESENYNEELLDKVLLLAEKPLFSKYGKRDTKYFDILVKDMQVLKKQIDYTSDGTTTNRTLDDKTGMPLLSDLEKDVKESISNPDQLDAALTTLRKNYEDLKDSKEEVYDAKYAEAMDIVTEKGGTYLDVENIEMFTKEDQQNIRNGHAEESDTATYADLLKNPSETTPENLVKYKHLLSQSDYKKFLAAGTELKQGGSKKVIAVTGDKVMLHKMLDDFKLTKFHTAKAGNANNKKYIRIQEAWHQEMNYMQETMGTKLSYTEKRNALEKILLDDVNIDNFAFFDKKNVNTYYELNEDRMDDVYVEVTNKDGEPINVFVKEIDQDEVAPLIMEALRMNGRPATQKNIAEMWIEYGRPKNKADAIKYNEELEALAEK